MRDSVLPVAKMGWCRFAAKGVKALAGNRVAAGKAAIVARHIAILTALQIDFEVLTEWGTQLVPCRLEIRRLHFCHICPPWPCSNVRPSWVRCVSTPDSDTATSA